MTRLLLVGLGGAAGSMLRYAVGLAFTGVRPGTHAWATLAVNVTGCFAIGLLATFFDASSHASEERRLALLVGVLGGYTTFSAFAWQSIEMARDGKPWLAAAYALATNALCLGGAALGWVVARSLFRAGA